MVGRVSMNSMARKADFCIGAKLMYLPLYSPDFNPIEEAFSSVKGWLRRHEAQAVNAEVRPWLIHQAIMAITEEHAKGWFVNCGYGDFD